MPRVALYARYSDDKQSPASIDDQFLICREQAAREGWRIVANYKDAAISGASVILRPGIQSLLQDAQMGRFDILLAEALDRVSRDQADVATLYKNLQFVGVKIVTLAEGEVSELHVGLKGTMNALFLKDLAKKTHRGLRGRVEKGKFGGGLCFGYDVVRRFSSEGEPVHGERSINAAEAEVIRQVFRQFANGLSPHAIACRLNETGIAAPTGKLWTSTTIRGHAKRGTGLLNNELYIGKLVWNRLRYLKNPQTGKRVSRINPKSEWIVTEVPDLRIVDEELWRAVKAGRRISPSNMPPSSRQLALPIQLLIERIAQKAFSPVWFTAAAVAVLIPFAGRGGLPVRTMVIRKAARTGIASRATNSKRVSLMVCAIA